MPTKVKAFTPEERRRSCGLILLTLFVVVILVIVVLFTFFVALAVFTFASCLLGGSHALVFCLGGRFLGAFFGRLAGAFAFCFGRHGSQSHRQHRYAEILSSRCISISGNPLARSVNSTALDRGLTRPTWRGEQQC
jgi:hypothetical protein